MGCGSYTTCGDGQLGGMCGTAAGRPDESSDESCYVTLPGAGLGAANFPTRPLHGSVSLILMQITTQLRITLLCAFALATLSLSAQTAPPPDPKTVPVIDGGIGPCSADFTVTDTTTAPVYAAKIRVHIAYRFMSFHKLDLEVGTNAAGKARFTGLPDRTKQALLFRASEGAREGSAFDDTAKTCKADFTIVLEKKTQ
jgi:hypothetical protein